MVILQADVPLQRAPSRIGKMAHRLAIQFDLDFGPNGCNLRRIPLAERL